MHDPVDSVFITGASSGLGEALARAYAARGARLGLAARRGDRLAALADELPVECRTYPLDVRDSVAMQAAARDFVSAWGAPSVVIANAGISHGTMAQDAGDLAVLDEVMRTNVVGMATTFQPFIAPMRLAGRGVLAGVASVAGVRGIPGSSAYSASKAAAIAWLESLRVELRDSGVAVVTLCPGYVDTPMTARNPYAMPFILPVGDAARLMQHAIDRRRPYAVLPWQMALVAAALRVLPRTLYDTLFARAPRKPRRDGSEGPK